MRGALGDRGYWALCLAALLVVGASGAALGQMLYLPSSVTAKEAPSGALLAAADALGMVRGVGSNVYDAVNRIEFELQGVGFEPQKHGAWKRFTIAQERICISYHQQALRAIVDRVDAQGSKTHTIEVVAGRYAWNEQSPGVGGVAAMQSVAERSRRIWLTPQGFIYQAELAGAKAVKVGSKAGRTTLSVLINGEPVTATLDAEQRPQLIEAQIHDALLGATTLSYEYSGYKDFDYYGVMFPSHMVERLGARTVLDATVSSLLTSTYFLFTPPEDIARLAAKAVR